MEDTFDTIVKAQDIYKKMIACEKPADFKKVFSDAIYEYSLTDFYPVVVRAQLAAALAACAEQTDVKGFNFTDYLYAGFGLRPHHFVQLSVQTVADIMERDARDVERMFRGFGYTTENGEVTSHPLDGAAPKIVNFADARKRKGAA
ncbi:MAG TPA: hypothetical protein VEF76_04445 [Patescibacteria group bacterium]|nr:hypothetical protein [Patescibacteria group bacterium]